MCVCVDTDTSKKKKKAECSTENFCFYFKNVPLILLHLRVEPERLSWFSSNGNWLFSPFWFAFGLMVGRLSDKKKKKKKNDEREREFRRKEIFFRKRCSKFSSPGFFPTNCPERLTSVSDLSKFSSPSFPFLFCFSLWSLAQKQKKKKSGENKDF